MLLMDHFAHTRNLHTQHGTSGSFFFNEIKVLLADILLPPRIYVHLHLFQLRLLRAFVSGSRGSSKANMR
jgi:hypothetical protein